ncbi:hypothetical protein D3C78_1273390 [compost metagenome]
MLDLCIREKTNNQKDLKTVIQYLSTQYGPNKPFKDDELLKEIVANTHPDVAAFIGDYITGSKPLPYQYYFTKLGYSFNQETKIQVYYPGNVGLKFENNNFMFSKVEQNALGIMENDAFVKINNIPVNPDTIDEVWTKYFNMNTEYPEISIVVNRGGQEKVLSGKIYSGTATVKNHLVPADKSSDEEKNNLKLLLKKG